MSDTHFMSGTQEIDDLPEEVISLARMLIRRCRAPGQYSLDFTVSDHSWRIETAVLARVERIQVHGKKRKHRKRDAY